MGAVESFSLSLSDDFCLIKSPPKVPRRFDEQFYPRKWQVRLLRQFFPRSPRLPFDFPRFALLFCRKALKFSLFARIHWFNATMTNELTLAEAEKRARLLTKQQAADRLDVCTKTLDDLVRKGDLPPPIRRSRSWVRYRAVDIEAYIRRLTRLDEMTDK